MSSVPREVLRDVLHPLNRRTLDAVQFTNRRFLQTILEQMSDVCLRQIVAASFKAANPNENTYATWFIHIRGRPGFPDRKIQSSHEDAARLFWEFLQALRSSRVTRLTFNGLVFTPGVVELVLETPIVADTLTLREGSCAELTPTQFHKLLLQHFSPTSLRIDACSLRACQIDDELIRALSKTAVRSTWFLNLVPVDGGCFAVTDDAIVDFCVQPEVPNGQEGDDAPRLDGELRVCNGTFTKNLFKRLIEASAVSRRAHPLKIVVSPLRFEAEGLRDYEQYLTVGRGDPSQQRRVYDFPREQHGTAATMDLQILLYHNEFEMIRGYPDFDH